MDLALSHFERFLTDGSSLTPVPADGPALPCVDQKDAS
jgi:hypothetical protein